MHKGIFRATGYSQGYEGVMLGGDELEVGNPTQRRILLLSRCCSYLRTVRVGPVA